MSVKKIIRDKAEFLASLEFDFIGVISQQQRLQAEIDKMPIRGQRQRESQEHAYRKADETLDRHALRLGHLVLGTFKFVRSNEKLLLASMRKRLLGEK